MPFCICRLPFCICRLPWCRFGSARRSCRCQSELGAVLHLTAACILGLPAAHVDAILSLGAVLHLPATCVGAVLGLLATHVGAILSLGAVLQAVHKQRGRTRPRWHRCWRSIGASTGSGIGDTSSHLPHTRSSVTVSAQNSAYQSTRYASGFLPMLGKQRMSRRHSVRIDTPPLCAIGAFDFQFWMYLSTCSQLWYVAGAAADLLAAPTTICPCYFINKFGIMQAQSWLLSTWHGTCLAILNGA